MRVRILPAGTNVTIQAGSDHIQGRIVASAIRAGGVVLFDVTYWAGDEQKLVALNAWEFTVHHERDWMTLESVDDD